MLELQTLLMTVLEREEPGSTDYIIADYILKNALQLDHISTMSLAKACNVSKASISRFCRHIGLEDFFTLQVMIKNYVPGKIVARKYNFKQTSEDDLDNFMNESIENIQIMKDTFDRKVLDELTTDIHDYDRIILMGTQQSGGIALALQNDLSSFGRFVMYVGDPISQREQLLKASSKDLVIIFSATGIFFERVLPREIQIKKEDIPRIYFITVTKTKDNPWIYKKIQLSEHYNFSSNLLLNFYASLIAIDYKNKYGVSFFETA